MIIIHLLTIFTLDYVYNMTYDRIFILYLLGLHTSLSIEYLRYHIIIHFFHMIPSINTNFIFVYGILIYLAVVLTMSQYIDQIFQFDNEIE